MSVILICVSQIMCTNFLTVTNPLLVILGRGAFSKSRSTFTRVRSNSVVTDVVRMACIWQLALIDICRFKNKGRKEKCLTFFRVFSESNWPLHRDLKFFSKIEICLYVLCTSLSAHVVQWFNSVFAISTMWADTWGLTLISKGTKD